MRTYNIVRFYEDLDRKPTVLQRGYTLEEARKYCDDPELSSYTAQSPKGCNGDTKKIEKWHKLKKHWFVGFVSD